MAHARNWFEIPVADMARAMRFYAALMGRHAGRSAASRRPALSAPAQASAASMSLASFSGASWGA